MSVGTNTAPNVLWKGRYKINTPDGGLNFSLHIAEQPAAVALAAFSDIAERLIALMPSTCEIFAAVMSMDNTSKDGQIIADAIGEGKYLQNGATPPATLYNKFDDAILCRFENTNGSGVTLKIAPVPDTIIGGGQILIPILPVTDATVVPTVLPVQPIVYDVEFTQLMQSIAKNCHHVSTKNHTPGGNYTYYAFSKAYAIRVGRKKGARVFTK